MIQIKPLDNKELILSTLRNKHIYKHLTDDSCPQNPDSFCIVSDLLLYLGVYQDDEYMGLFVIHRHNYILYEVHTCLLPVAWGSSVDYAKSCISWMFQNTDCKRLITNVPDGNTLAIRLAQKSGMDIFGYNPSSFLKNGQLIGQTILGVSKCQH